MSIAKFQDPLEETFSQNSGPTPFSLSDGIADLVNIAKWDSLELSIGSSILMIILHV